MVVCAPDSDVLINCVLQLNHRQWQTIDEHHDVGSTVVLTFDHRELVHCQPVVGAGVAEIDQPGVVTGDTAIGAAIFHLDAITQHLVKAAVGRDQRGCGDAQNFAQGLVLGLGWDLRVQTMDRGPKPSNQHDIAEGFALRRCLSWGKAWTVSNCITQFPEP